MNIVYKSEKKLEITSKQKVIDIFKKEIELQDSNIIACKCNNEVKSLNYEVEPGDKVELIDTTTRDGRRVYIRGVTYIMAKALYELYPQALLTVNYQLSNSMLCEIENMEITEELIKRISEKMHEIVNKNIEIKKVEMTKEEAIKFYEKEKTLRGILQLDNKEKEEVSLYFCEEYYNYFYGVMPISTGFIDKFEVVKYHDGFLLRYPSKYTPNVLEKYNETKKLLNTLDEYEDIYKTLKINTVYRLNKAISEGKAQDIISLSEALHEKKISDLADKIVEKKDVKAILIAGPSSSGKTTFSKRLGVHLRLNGLKPVTISVDNYFVERKDNPRHSDGTYDFECIEAIDLKLFNEHLTKLLDGEEIDVPTFNFKTGHKEYHGEKMRLAQDEVLVMEGIHCLNDKLTEAISKDQKYKIYISALTVLNIDYFNRISTTDTRLIRRIVRDYQFRSYSALHTLETWLSVNQGEEKYIYPFQEDADSMFNTSLIYELCVLKKHAHPLLKEITNASKEFSEAKNLYNLLNYFEDIPDELVPKNSLLREFIGGSIYED